MKDIEINEIKKKQNIEAEKDFFKQELFIDSAHWISHPLLISRERAWLKYHVEKIRFYSYLFGYIKNKPYKNKAKVLLAPVGDGRDLEFLIGIYQEVYGIDVSAIQLSKCPKLIITNECDVLDSGYDDESFDIIVVAGFLHHLHEAGIEPFIKEFYRMLRKDGSIAFLEPSSMYPFSWVTALAEKIFGSFPDKVKGEKPISPLYIKRVLRNSGFQRIHIRGMTFNHPSFPFFIQSLINTLDPLFKIFWFTKFFSSGIGFFCEKKK